MMRFPRTHSVMVRVLFASALCLHLLIAGASAGAQSQESITGQPNESVRLVAMPQSDGLAARLPQSSLTLGKAPRQSHHLAAAFISLPTVFTLTGKRADTVNLTVAKVSLARSLSASRAPPALVA
jgi:hypothetical protein